MAEIREEGEEARGAAVRGEPIERFERRAVGGLPRRRDSSAATTLLALAAAKAHTAAALPGRIPGSFRSNLGGGIPARLVPMSYPASPLDQPILLRGEVVQVL